MKATLKVSRSGEPERRFHVVDRAIIGSGTDCAIRLEDTAMMSQHLSLKPMEEGVKVRLAQGASPMTHQGAEFAGGIVPYDSDFYVGMHRFTVSRTDAVGGHGGPSPVILAAAGVAIALMVLSLLSPATVDSAAATEIQIPELFTEQACEVGEGQHAHRAKEAERGAHAKQERYIYDPHDGVLAGRLLAEASACYALAQDDEGSKRTAQDGAAWRQRIMSDVNAARLRLELALDNGDRARALDHVRDLLRLLSGEELPVVDQMIRLGSRIEHELKGTKR